MTDAVSARDRYVTEAARLFAERGYAATSVGDIQRACGLTAGSGALYKHFRSKRDLLDAVVDRHVATIREGRALVADLPEDLVEALTAIAHAVRSAMDRDHLVLRVLLRDLDAFPDLLGRLWDEVRAGVYGGFADWLRARPDVTATDPDATAAVLIASLTCAPLLEALIGRHPGDIDPDRFLRTWIDQATSVLRAARA